MAGTRSLWSRMAREDDGMTLMEMVIGMAVMGIFMAIFSGVIFTMAGTVNNVQAVTTSASQVNTAFITLDKLVRYAAAVTTAGQGASGDWYQELDFVDNTTSIETCTQLRVDLPTQQLQERTWTATGASTYTNLSNWKMLASGITNGNATAGSANAPFSVPVVAGSATSAYQRLTVTLVAAETGSGTATTRSQMTFTAENSSATSTTNATKCQQPGVGRP